MITAALATRQQLGPSLEKHNQSRMAGMTRGGRLGVGDLGIWGSSRWWVGVEDGITALGECCVPTVLGLLYLGNLIRRVEICLMTHMQ